jgi:bis(5'-nucleosidyl)-tetraphosphatase
MIPYVYMREEHSYGFVLVYRGGETDLFLLVCQATHWSLPKGHIEEGETPLAAASRELLEETGISDISILPGFEFKEEYIFDRAGVPTLKLNTYFLATVPTMDDVLVPDIEITEYRFLPLDEALTLFSFEAARHMLREAATALQSIPRA